MAGRPVATSALAQAAIAGSKSTGCGQQGERERVPGGKWGAGWDRGCRGHREVPPSRPSSKLSQIFKPTTHAPPYGFIMNEIIRENDTGRRGVSGAHTTNGIPHGVTSLTPFLAVPHAADAIRFYESVFGARLIDLTEMGGVVVHADLDFGNGHLQLGEPNPDYGLVQAPAGDEDCYSMGLYCADVDEAVRRAEEAGATIREAPSDFVSGDRFASIRDPFGVRWSIMSRVEDLSEDESAGRVAKWAAEQQIESS